MQYDGKNTIAKADGKTEDIIQALINISPRGVDNVKPYINDLFVFTGDAFKDAVMIAAYIRNNVQYLADNYQNQNIQLPGRMFFNTKKADCKSFSLAFFSLMTAAGHTCGYRFASYRKSKIPTHVYNWFVDNKKNFYTFDTCVFHLNESKRYTYIKDMNVNYLTGSEEIEILNGREERRERRKKRREEGKGFFQRVKKVALTVPRNAFRGLVALNVRGLAKHLNEAITKNPTKVKEFWQKLGGKFDGKNSLMGAINDGKNKKPLLGEKKSKGVNGYDNEPYIGFAIEAAIAGAAPILIAIKKLMADVGIKPEDIKNLITPEEEKEAEESGNTFKDGNFEASDPEPGVKTPASGAGFKLSPLLIGRVISAVALVWILSTKKKK
jgi:hypothetical protein